MISGLENPIHWLIVLAIALIVLGPKRLPEAGRSLGQAMRGFKESISGNDREEPHPEVQAAPPAPAPAAEPVAPSDTGTAPREPAPPGV